MLRILSSRFPGAFATRSLALVVLSVCLVSIGCDSTEPVIVYEVPTEVPPQLRAGKERMLAAMIPKGDQVWFFKVTGPEEAIGTIESTYRQFVESIEIKAGTPDLQNLPDGWRRGGSKPMRFASIDVETPNKQLDISVSQLGRPEDWDDFVVRNVNRWRGQLELQPSTEKWAGGAAVEIAAGDATSVWVDLLGEPSSAGSMSPPFANRQPPPSAASSPPRTSPIPSRDSSAGGSGKPDQRLKFDRPEGWRDGRTGSMRWAAFNVGPEESQAEITVMDAGGDLRSNVARWLGQIRGEQVPSDVVGQALDAVQKFDVDGRPSQRFLLTAADENSGDAIDVTIVPLENGMSLFIKMKGPVETVTTQSDNIQSFLESLSLNL